MRAAADRSYGWHETSPHAREHHPHRVTDQRPYSERLTRPRLARKLESSQVLVAPGLRTLPRTGWRSGVTTAWNAVTRDPQLWLLGALGFALRGGIVLLTLPIVALPTQVEVRLLIGDYLGSTGFTPSFWVLLTGFAAGAALLTVGILLGLARLELHTFERLIANSEVQADTELATTRFRGDRRRRSLFVKLFGVQVLAFVALIACVAPVAWLAVRAAYAEVTLPSSSAPIYERVLGTIAEPLFFLLVAIVIVEMLSALATREILARAYGGRRVRRSRSWHAPARVIGTSLLSWTATLLAVLPALWALGAAWSATRAAFLTSVSFADFGDDIAMAAAALALSAAFVLALFVGGFASAFRAALWSLTRLR